MIQLERRNQIRKWGIHLAGIIPVSGYDDNFGFDWHDCLMPIGDRFTIIERAVVELAYAGANTIWIICNDDIQPLIKFRLGDWARDPLYLKNHYISGRTEREITERTIPIYYIPMGLKHLKRRDSMAWSIIYGALVASRISRKLSKWVAPHKFYVSFPMSMYPPGIVIKHRSEIKRKKRVFMSYEGKTVKDNKLLGFSFDYDDFMLLKRNFYKEERLLFTSENMIDGFPVEKLKKDERYTGKSFTLKDVFDQLTLEENEEEVLVDVPWFFEINNWDSYCEFLSTPYRKKVKKPRNYVINKYEPKRGTSLYRSFNSIGEDCDENEGDDEDE